MVRSLVSLDGFQIAKVTHDWIFVGNSVGAEEIAADAGAIEGDGDIIALEHGNVCRSEFAAVLEASSLDAQELRHGDLGDHPGVFLLNELVGGDGPVVELLAQDGIGARGFVAIHGGADDAPADAEARLGEAGKRRFEALGRGQALALGDAAIGEGEAGGNAGAHGAFAVDLRGGVARRAALHQEADDALLGPRPDYGHIGHAAVGDPGLLAVEHPGVAIAARGGAKAGGMGPKTGFGKAEATVPPAALQGGQPPLLLWLPAGKTRRGPRRGPLAGRLSPPRA